MIEELLMRFRDKLMLCAAGAGDELELLAMAVEVDKALANGNGQWPMKTTTKLLARLGAKRFKALLDARLEEPAKHEELLKKNQELQAQADAEFNVDSSGSMAQLLKALEAGAKAPTPAARLDIQPIDTSGWDEFPEKFFDLPVIPSTLAQTEEHFHGDAVRRVFPCGYISVGSTDKEKAIAGLRGQLATLAGGYGKVILGFLAKPSLVQTVRLVKPGETPDVPIVVDLKGHQPGKVVWQAFCFVHGYFYEIFTPETFKSRGIAGGVQEGQIGVEI